MKMNQKDFIIGLLTGLGISGIVFLYILLGNCGV